MKRSTAFLSIILAVALPGLVLAEPIFLTGSHEQYMSLTGTVVWYRGEHYALKVGARIYYLNDIDHLPAFVSEWKEGMTISAEGYAERDGPDPNVWELDVKRVTINGQVYVLDDDHDHH